MALYDAPITRRASRKSARHSAANAGPASGLSRHRSYTTNGLNNSSSSSYSAWTGPAFAIAYRSTCTRYRHSRSSTSSTGFTACGKTSSSRRFFAITRLALSPFANGFYYRSCGPSQSRHSRCRNSQRHSPRNSRR